MSLKSLTRALRSGARAIEACGDAIEQAKRVHSQVGAVVEVGAEAQQALQAGAKKLSATLEAAKVKRSKANKPKPAEVIRIVDRRTGTEK